MALGAGAEAPPSSSWALVLTYTYMFILPDVGYVRLRFQVREAGSEKLVYTACKLHR